MNTLFKRFLMLSLMVLGLNIPSLQADVVKIEDYKYYDDAVFAEVVSSSSAMAGITDDGRLFTWGYGAYGVLGVGDTVNRKSPQDITQSLSLAPGEMVTHVDIGNAHMIAATSMNRLFGWGWNNAGEVGDNTRVQRNTPVEITSNFTFAAGENIADVGAGGSTSYVIGDKGTVYSWGMNNTGALGDGTTETRFLVTDQTAFFTLPVGEFLTEIDVRGAHVLALSTLGKLYGWGDNGQGQLFTGDSIDLLLIEDLSGYFTLEVGETFIAIGAGSGTSVVSTSLGKVFTSGDNLYGQLGDGTAVDKSSPVNITSGFSLQPGEIVTMLDSYRQTIASTNMGRVFGWGYNINKQLTSSCSSPQYVPKDITATMNFNPLEEPLVIAITSVSSHILTSDYSLLSWGSNNYGQFGGEDFSLAGSWTPVRLAAHFNVLEVEQYIGTGYIDFSTAGNSSFAIGSNNNIYSFGDNTYGQLGTGDTVEARVPVNITDNFTLDPGETFINIEAGERHGVVLTSLGRVFTWGNNQYGQIGDNTTASFYQPKDITSFIPLDPGDYIVKIFAGGYNTFLISDNEKVYAFGRNTHGQLGNNSYSNSLIPVDITANFGFAVGESIIEIDAGFFHTFALTNQDNLFAFGWNVYGQLGNDTLFNVVTPLNINAHLPFDPAVEQIVDIETGYTYSGLVTEDGNVYMWGQNGNGSLGDLTTIDRIVPYSITNQFALDAGETVVSLSIGLNHSFATSSNGKVFSWGYGNRGCLGDNNITDNTYPTDVTATTTIDSDTVSMYVLGNQTSFVITNEGNLYGFGENTNGEMGLDSLTTVIYNPLRITKDGTEINKVGFIFMKDETLDTATHLEMEIYFEFDIFPDINTLTISGVTYPNTLISGSVGKVVVSIPNTYTLGDELTFTLESIGLFSGSLTPGGPLTVTTTIVSDTTPPSFDVPSAITIDVESSDVDWTTYMANVIDDSGGPITLSETDGVTYGIIGDYIVTVTAADLSGNETSKDITVKLEDMTPPVLSYIGVVEFELGSTPPDFTILFTAIDAYYGDISGDIIITDLTDFSVVGDYTVTANVTDVDDNSAELIINIGIVDTTPPVISSPPIVTIEAGSSYIALDNYTTYSDIAGTQIILTEDNTIIYDTVGTYSVSVTATDASGNAATTYFDVVVEDTTPPTFDVIPDMEFEIFVIESMNWEIYVNNVVDNTTGYTVTYDDQINYSFPGFYNVTVFVEDGYGNIFSRTHVVEMVDSVEPAIGYTLPIELELGSDIDDLMTFFQIYDDVEGDIPYYINVDDSQINFNSVGTYLLLITVRDSSNNENYQEIEINIIDVIPPVLTLTSSVELELGEYSSMNWIDYVIDAEDDSDTAVVLDIVSTDVDFTAIGNYSVVISATDASGNSVDGTIIVNITDSTAPTFDLITDQEIEVEITEFNWLSLVNNVTDNSMDQITISITENTVVYGVTGAYLVTIKATDNSMNEWTNSFTVLIVDSTAPVITTDASFETTIEMGELYEEPVVECIDNYDETCVVLKTGEVDDAIADTYQITYIAIDSSGNQSSLLLTVFVMDTSNPVIELNSGIDTIYVGEIYTDAGVEYSDNGEVTVVITGTVDTETVGTYIITYTITDDSSNETQIKRYVNVLEKMPEYEFVIGNSLTTLFIGDQFTSGVCKLLVNDNEYQCVIDTSNLNLMSAGTYKVYYRATINSVDYEQYIIVTYIEVNELIVYYYKEEELEV